MHTTAAEAVMLATRINQLATRVDDVDIVLLPPVIWLPTLIEALPHRAASLQFGVQHVYPQDEGAFTGEIGLQMIRRLVRYVLVGHSERRTLFGATDEVVNEQLHATLRAGFHPILCVGELTKVVGERRGRGRPTLLQKQSNIMRQLTTALAGITERSVDRLVICYEPLWAIGNNDNVPAPHVQMVLEEIRAWLAKRYGPAATGQIRTIYGGSVNPDDVGSYMTQPDIDGVLVGTAALQIQTLLPIIETVAERTHLVQHPDHGA